MSQFEPALANIAYALKYVGGVSDLKTGDSAEPIHDILMQAARFAKGVLAPLDAVGDREGCVFDSGSVRTPPGFREAYRKYVDAGWSTLQFRKEMGGPGVPTSVAVAVAEIFNAANMSLTMGLQAAAGGAELVSRFGTPDQKERYLPHIVNGRWTVTMMMTEPQAGSDMSLIRTRAVSDGDGYRIFGRKQFITFGDQDLSDNIVHLILAKTDAPGNPISLFITTKTLLNPDGTPGELNDIQCTGIENKMGLHGSPTASLVLGEKVGAYAELLGTVGQGLQQMFVLMNRARINVGVFGVASAERARQAAGLYALERVQGKDPSRKPVPIAHHPDVQRMLLSMRSRTEAARNLAYYAASLMDIAGDQENAGSIAAQSRLELLTPIVKTWCTESGFAVSSDGVQIFGGMGYIVECEASQYFRDARIHMIYEGTTGIQANDFLTRKIIRDKGAVALPLIREMQLSLDELQNDDTVQFEAANELRKALATLIELTDYAISRSPQDLPSLQAWSVPYLLFFGEVVAGWLTLRAFSEFSRDKVRDADMSKRLGRSLLFLVSHMLPASEAAARSMTRDATPILDEIPG
ncbi:acyl-CoA dehydrogenase [Bradyrhizobium sp. CB82]|uniref:acyl-CoA dehydrogenase n=1 Tax=Bradyrhizobium sp. CB82 TaxID=3039159 RepID=UPI0024B22BFA|nr:acyl-CoA dehydrogenase [Bradyrhizobium sp. CB82]WFU41515.1 acyl-CoA dehydrogenase [Bradyrhizobium sp. CB82]